MTFRWKAISIYNRLKWYIQWIMREITKVEKVLISENIVTNQQGDERPASQSQVTKQ